MSNLPRLKHVPVPELVEPFQQRPLHIARKKTLPISDVAVSQDQTSKPSVLTVAVRVGCLAVDGAKPKASKSGRRNSSKNPPKDNPTGSSFPAAVSVTKRDCFYEVHVTTADEKKMTKGGGDSPMDGKDNVVTSQFCVDEAMCTFAEFNANGISPSSSQPLPNSTQHDVFRTIGMPLLHELWTVKPPKKSERRNSRSITQQSPRDCILLVCGAPHTGKKFTAFGSLRSLQHQTSADTASPDGGDNSTATGVDDSEVGLIPRICEEMFSPKRTVISPGGISPAKANGVHVARVKAVAFDCSGTKTLDLLTKPPCSFVEEAPRVENAKTFPALMLLLQKVLKSFVSQSHTWQLLLSLEWVFGLDGSRKERTTTLDCVLCTTNDVATCHFVRELSASLLQQPSHSSKSTLPLLPYLHHSQNIPRTTFLFTISPDRSKVQETLGTLCVAAQLKENSTQEVRSQLKQEEQFLLVVERKGSTGKAQNKGEERKLGLPPALPKLLHATAQSRQLVTPKPPVGLTKNVSAVRLAQLPPLESNNAVGKVNKSLQPIATVPQLRVRSSVVALTPLPPPKLLEKHVPSLSDHNRVPTKPPPREPLNLSEKAPRKAKHNKFQSFVVAPVVAQPEKRESVVAPLLTSPREVSFSSETSLSKANAMKLSKTVRCTARLNSAVNQEGKKAKEKLLHKEKILRGTIDTEQSSMIRSLAAMIRESILRIKNLTRRQSQSRTPQSMRGCPSPGEKKLAAPVRVKPKRETSTSSAAPSSTSQQNNQRAGFTFVGGVLDLNAAVQLLVSLKEDLQCVLESGVFSDAETSRAGSREVVLLSSVQHLADALLSCTSTEITDTEAVVVHIVSSVFMTDIQAPYANLVRGYVEASFSNKLGSISLRDVVLEHGLFTAALTDGSVVFLKEFMRLFRFDNGGGGVPGIEMSELFGCAFFNQQSRIPLTLLLLQELDQCPSLHTQLQLTLEDVSPTLVSEFFSDICNRRKQIPRENRSGRNDLVAYLLAHPLLGGFAALSIGEPSELDGHNMLTRACRDGDFEVLEVIAAECGKRGELPLFDKALLRVSKVDGNGEDSALIQCVVGNSMPCLVFLLTRAEGYFAKDQEKGRRYVGARSADHGTAADIAVLVSRDSEMVTLLKKTRF